MGYRASLEGSFDSLGDSSLPRGDSFTVSFNELLSPRAFFLFFVASFKMWFLIRLTPWLFFLPCDKETESARMQHARAVLGIFMYLELMEWVVGDSQDPTIASVEKRLHKLFRMLDRQGEHQQG